MAPPSPATAAAATVLLGRLLLHGAAADSAGRQPVGLEVQVAALERKVAAAELEWADSKRMERMELHQMAAQLEQMEGWLKQTEDWLGQCEAETAAVGKGLAVVDRKRQRLQEDGGCC